MILVSAFVIYYILGLFGAVRWWTSTLDLEIEDFIFMAVIGWSIAPLFYLIMFVDWVQTKLPDSGVIIKARNR